VKVIQEYQVRVPGDRKIIVNNQGVMGEKKDGAKVSIKQFSK